MTVTINGTTGITNDGGYTGDGVVFADTTPANTLVTTTGGNVGIGTSSPSAKLVTNGPAQFIGSGAVFPTTGCGVEIVGAPNGSPSYIQAYNRDNSTWQQVDLAGSVVSFRTGGSERARIDSSGNLLVGTTTTYATNSRVSIAVANNTAHGMSFRPADAAGAYRAINFYNNALSAVVGYIDCSTTTTVYATSSDYRLKENIQPMTGALAKVELLKPCTYNWKEDGSDGEGFIAHELQAVVPQCVIGEKDAVDAEGNPVYQGIDTSFLVATLTAAIQEQQAIITALTARVAALEGTQP